MSNYRKLQHSEWECKYHVVFIPKYRRKVLYGTLRQHLGEVFHRLARQKESEIEEGHLMSDHVHRINPEWDIPVGVSSWAASARSDAVSR